MYIFIINIFQFSHSYLKAPSHSPPLTLLESLFLSILSNIVIICPIRLDCTAYTSLHRTSTPGVVNLYHRLSQEYINKCGYTCIKGFMYFHINEFIHICIYTYIFIYKLSLYLLFEIYVFIYVYRYTDVKIAILHIDEYKFPCICK
jgi:hypothetical protein